jgi:hypothetical protein
MLEQRVKTLHLAREMGIECQCICIGDPENVSLARDLGFIGEVQENILGAKYNTGHQYAVNQGYDVSFHCNSDQVFSPELLVKLAESPQHKLIRTIWLTMVHDSGKKSISYRDRINWGMTAYPHQLLKKAPRPCGEKLMRMCDTSTRAGVFMAQDSLVEEHTVEVSPLETIQFESGFQLTPWKNNIYRGLLDHKHEGPVPWGGIADIHGEQFTQKMKEFYRV